MIVVSFAATFKIKKTQKTSKIESQPLTLVVVKIGLLYDKLYT